MKIISRHNLRYGSSPKNSKCVNELKNIILMHIKANIKDYLVLSIILIIGVMIGVVLINNSNETSKNEISGYITSFIDSIKKEEFKIDKIKLTKISIFQNIKLVILIWIASTTIIGIPIIYIITAYKGICIGYTISAIIYTLGTWKRFIVFYIIIIFTKYNCNTYYINVKCKCVKIISNIN